MEKKIKDFLFQNDQPMLLHTYQKVNCSSCSVTDKELFTKFYKDELKKSILKFLKMERAPNVSVEDLPSHLVNHFKKLYDEDDLQAATTANNAGSMMMSDQASEEDEEDSKSFKTNLVHVFSKNRKLIEPLCPQHFKNPVKVFALCIANASFWFFWF